MSLQKQQAGIASLPLEILDEIVEYIICRCSKVIRRRILLNLRRVNRKCQASASRLVFSDLTVRVVDCPPLAGKNRPFLDLEIFCQTSIACYVQNLNILYRNPWRNFAGQREQLETLFPIFIKQLPRLRRIHFQPIEVTPGQRNMTRELVKVMTDALRDLPGCFEEFSLEHSHTQHHERPSTPPPPDENLPTVLRRVKHVQLKHNSTSPCEREISHIFDQLQDGECLLSVELSGLADIETEGNCSGFVHPDAPLSDITLESVTTSAERLLALKECRKTLQHVILFGVKLTSGRWADVFRELQKCPNLRWLEVHGCGYAMMGKSPHLIDGARKAGVLSSSDTDVWALAGCQVHAQNNRAVLGDKCSKFRPVDPFGRSVSS
ncbi:hypothetical protein BO71DRAFT_489045 [Aspergillus ellipticus CBS 707.79]|uniref:F-box domain-containing protein n=1 Tax=Aspergillus ellipticus CBS 707.79 TaxID=1448320 RepID=A0A319CS02_9EURO|nr:hypothetical protein BO71DRAFT_489045 [Aspergillus ellipticus CBS 707.79]